MRAAADDHATDEPGRRPSAAPAVRPSTVTLPERPPESVRTILVPQINPDGSEAGTRRNAADADLNRNHVILSEPEVRALHELFLDWMPEVTLDIHETNVAKTSWMTIDYPVFDLRTWTSRVAELGNFDSKVVPLLTVERPSVNAADDTWR